MLIGYISLVVSIIIGLYISNRLHTTIAKLKNATNEIGRGNLDTRIDINTKDEIEELGNAFNKMTQDLKTSLDKQKITQEQLKKSLQEKTYFFGKFIIVSRIICRSFPVFSFFRLKMSKTKNSLKS